MSELKRYEEGDPTTTGMIRAAKGDWVEYDDAKALQDEIEGLKNTNRVLSFQSLDKLDHINALIQRLAEVEKGHVMAPVELVQELAYIGTDVGYAPFEPDPKHVHKAREIVALYKQALSNEEVTDEAISKT